MLTYRASPRTASPGPKRTIKKASGSAKVKKVSKKKVSKKVSKKKKVTVSKKKVSKKSVPSRKVLVPSKPLTFQSYLFKVLKQVHPDCGITQNAMSSVNSLERDLFEMIMTEALKLSKSTKSTTVTSREILNATRLVLPGELAKHAVSEGIKAVTHFQSHSPGRKRTTQSSRASVVFPVGRIHTFMKTSHPKIRIGPRASVFMAAVLEYLAAEVLELSGNVTKDMRLKRITPRAIMIAIRGDSELNRLTNKVTVRDSGVPPNMLAALLPKK